MHVPSNRDYSWHMCLNAELLDLELPLHQHVDFLRSLGKHEVEWVEVYTASVPLDLLCATDACKDDICEENLETGE